MCTLDRVSEVDREAWDTTSVAEVMRTSVPSARLTWSLREAVNALNDSSSEILAVCDEDEYFVGIVAESEIVKLYEILDATET